MNTYLIANIITCVCALAGFIYGIVRFFKPDVPVFAKMVTMAAGCMAFGGLYQIIRLWVGRDITTEFQLGILGFVGSLLFLFTASYGSIDKVIDNKSRELRKYRLIPLIAPVVIAAVYVSLILVSAGSTMLNKIIGAVDSVFAMLLSYISLKHLIMPDDGSGLAKALKPYDLLVLIYSLCCVAQMLALTVNNGIASLIVAVITGVDLLLLVPSVGKGVKKWTT